MFNRSKASKRGARVDVNLNVTDNVVAAAVCAGITVVTAKVVEATGILLLGMMDNHHEEKMAKKCTKKNEE